MLLEIFKFELSYRSKRPATYIYFGLIFLLAFGAATSDAVKIGGGAGLVKENAPATIARMMMVMSAFFIMITSAIMGVAVLRDFEHKTESLMFSTPIKKRDYLFGRFLGSFLVCILVFSAIPLGYMIGEFMPWREADRLLPFNLWHYMQPFLFILLPNVFFMGVLFFASGALSRSMLVVYVQGILLLVVYEVAMALTRDVDNESIAAIIDPLFVRTSAYITQYWTVSEQNTQVIAMEGVALYNRLIWVGVGILGLIATYFGFSFNVVRGSIFGNKGPRKRLPVNPQDAAIEIPTVTSNLGWGANWAQLKQQTVFYMKQVLTAIPFWAMVFCGMLILLVGAANMPKVFGTNTLPTTYKIIELIRGFNIFFIIILVFYSGELIWRERQVKINLIYDAMPMPDFISIISKFFSLMLIFLLLIGLLIITGIGIQTVKGFYEYDLGLYISRTLIGTMPTLVLFTLLAFFVQVMVNNKFMGHSIMIIFFGVTLILSIVGVEHNLLRFASGSLGSYSEMNGYGHYPLGFTWFKFYWLAFTCILFAVTILLSVRGSEAALKARLKVGKVRLTKPIIVMASVGLVGFITSGSYIYYNTNVLNTYQNSDEGKEERADYEKQLKKYEYLAQPKIVDVNLKVDLYPKERDYAAEGQYTIANKSSQPIENIHVQLNTDSQIEMEYVRFDRKAVITEEYENFQYYIYKLDEPLAVGDSMRLEFKQLFVTKGFVEGGSSTGVVFNGTFINNREFPTFGYNSGFELSDDNTRKDYDLAPKARLSHREDERELAHSFLGDDGDHINYEVVVSTEGDQIALSPGYLQREWEEKGRKYYHYKMDKPMMNFYSILSAEYEVERDEWKPENDSLGSPVKLEIYYHKGHEYNLDRMMKGMKASLDYYSKNFSPYQYQQMRILEFPRYQQFAQSFANTVPFSEGIGFMLDIDDKKDVDVTFYVTAHEMAHQWWAHQIVPANVQGSQVLSESLSQYAALMVMKSAYREEKVQQFLKQELKRYLGGRASESKREMPLNTVESQSYIHYGKGANVFYTLQDYIGEDSLNLALKRFIKEWSIYGKQIEKGRFPTTLDLMPYINEVTPDSMTHIIDDLFNKITLFENKTNEATYRELSEGKYEVEVEVEAKKLYADSLGVEAEASLNDYLEIGIYTDDQYGEDSLLYLEKHHFTEPIKTLVLEVDKKPTKAGIDPIHKLIDRTPSDNTKRLSKAEEDNT